MPKINGHPEIQPTQESFKTLSLLLALKRVWLDHRHLKLRTEDSHARVHELGSIRFFNVTSANVVAFLPKFVHKIIQVCGKGSKFCNDMIYIYDFIKHDTLLPSDFACITRYMTYPVLVLYECSTDC